MPTSREILGREDSYVLHFSGPTVGSFEAATRAQGGIIANSGLVPFLKRAVGADWSEQLALPVLPEGTKFKYDPVWAAQMKKLRESVPYFTQPSKRRPGQDAGDVHGVPGGPLLLSGAATGAQRTTGASKQSKTKKKRVEQPAPSIHHMRLRPVKYCNALVIERC